MNAPLLTTAHISPTVAAEVTDETGGQREHAIAAEYPLTLYLNGREMVTLMTLGSQPEALTLGWLRNQRLLADLSAVEEVRVDWEVNAAAVYTHNGEAEIVTEDETRIVTSGCGQGTMFGRLMEEVEAVAFVREPYLTAAVLLDILRQIREWDTVYKKAGAVHGCALAEHDGSAATVRILVEDIGRHNAVDTIAGWMWLNSVSGDGKVFYTTGRLTSEMVIKCAQMRIPYLVSRSGVTGMGHSVANRVGLTMIGRAINRRYLLFSGGEHFIP